jgi:hypothetical protein
VGVVTGQVAQIGAGRQQQHADPGLGGSRRREFQPVRRVQLGQSVGRCHVII